MPKAAHKSDQACAVRLGKVLLQSMSTDRLLSINDNELRHVATINSEIFVYAHENPAFAAILQRTVNTIDGRIVQLLCSFLYPERTLYKQSGSDFIYKLADHANSRGERVFLLGAEGASNQGTIEVLKARCPGLMIDGYSPEFSSNIADEKWNQAILTRIARFQPAHLVVCFGPVKQEMWISHLRDRLVQIGVRGAYGLGGTLDFVSGRKQRAPRWMQIAGAEWLFRLLTEKGRLARTLKMFKMPYFALKFYKRESEILGRGEVGAQISSAREC